MLQFRCWLICCAALMGGARGVFAQEPDEPKVDVQLLAEHKGLVPGETATLAIAFTIEDDWHIYWQNRGEGGLEPKFTWHLPPGFKVGPIRYPAPERHIDENGEHTFILSGEPVLLASLEVPKELKPGESVTLGLDAEWLACDKLCVRGEKSVSLKLPVVNPGEKAEPADPITFKVARADLPMPVGKAKYLKSITAKANVDKIPPSGEFQVILTVEIAADHHLNSNAPLNKFSIPTDLFPYRADGLTFSRPRFPLGETEKQAPDIKASVYRDKFSVTLPVKAGAQFKSDSVDIGGVLTYQACSDKTKQCYPRAAAEWQLKLPVGRLGEKAAMTPADDAQAASETPEPPMPTAKQAEEGSAEPSAAPATVEPNTSASASPPKPVVMPVKASGFFGRLQAGLESLGLIGLLIGAFLGGLIMNIMPCVLPVISIKVLSFVQQAKESRLRVLTLGLAFALGIQISFIVLGLLILGLLRWLGLEAQWGGLFQRPQVLIVLAAIVTAFALSLFGVFTLAPPRFVFEAGERVNREGHLNAFAMGLLATILGTACTAPLVSPAVGIAVTKPPAIGMLIFVVLGFGMALPYVAFAIHPAWLRFVPKPGPWLKVFEHIMGFLLFGTVVFLLYPLVAQLGAEGLFWTLVFLLFVAGAAWAYGRAGFGTSGQRRLICYGGSVALIALGWWLSFGLMADIPALMETQLRILKGEHMVVRADDWGVHGDEIRWGPYQRRRTLDLVSSGKTVFVDYTADWCVNCKANEKAIINTPEIRAAMKRLGVVPIRADFTLPDKEIRADLERFQRAGVPMYVIYPANRPNEPILLNEILTKSAVLEGLEQAGPSSRPAMSVAASGD